MNTDKEIEKLKKRISGLEKTLQIVSGHSGRIEKNLRQLFEAVSDTMPVPMLITSETGSIFFFNGKARDIFGYSEEKFYTINAVDLYQNPQDRFVFLKMLDHNGHVRGFAVNLKKSDGYIFPASLFSQQIMFENQDCLLSVIHDLSALRQEEEKRMILERQVRQTQKMEAIGTFASGIAHDFNNILSVIFGRSELAMMMLPEDSKAISHIHKILEAANRAKSMTSQILAFCRQDEQEKRAFHIYPILNEAVKMIRTMIHPNIEVRFRAEIKSSVILGDPTQIHQVVMNLCSNANHALRGRGGMIEIRLTELFCHDRMIPNLRAGTYTRMTISDNGPGIDKTIIERIFEPFFTTKAPGEGTGMGLAVVHGILLNHGGMVSVESEPGRGATFHCYIPVAAGTEFVKESAEIRSPIRGGTERILLVDDEKDITDTLVKILKSMGYDVTAITDSTEALKLFLSAPNSFDLVITDYIMPIMSGMVMASEMRRTVPDIPIIMITGSVPEPAVFSDAGFDTVIRKPFRANEIGAAIRAILDKKQGIYHE